MRDEKIYDFGNYRVGSESKVSLVRADGLKGRSYGVATSTSSRLLKNTLVRVYEFKRNISYSATGVSSVLKTD